MLAVKRWVVGADRDGLNTLARMVLGRRGAKRAGGGNESLASFFAGVDAPGLVKTWGRTAMLTAARVHTAERMRQTQGGASRSRSGGGGKADKWSFERVNDGGGTDSQRKSRSGSGMRESLGMKEAARPAWGSSSSIGRPKSPGPARPSPAKSAVTKRAGESLHKQIPAKISEFKCFRLF